MIISIFLLVLISKIECLENNREFRAAWIATVANIDWPSRRGLEESLAKNELIQQLDLAQELRLNAIIFQIRPACDAYYDTKLEPWSYWLSGQNGLNPGWDPLQFIIDEGHKRSLEIHVWLNPYRANHPSGPPDDELSPLSPANTHPEYAYKLSGGYIWMDPGAQVIQIHNKAVVRDIVTRYDIDGLHYDDYFYPYPSYNNNDDFPDDVTYNRYVNSGGQMNRADWRRDNVNLLIKDTYDIIKDVKPWVTFGVSPFGIWRPDNPPGIVGMDAYEELYADSKEWINQGWLDYIAPQLYWSIDSTGQPFEPLFNWWNEQNLQSRHVIPGLYTAGILSHVNRDWLPDEIRDQVQIVRNASLDTSPGVIHYSMQAFTASNSESEAMNNMMKEEIYPTLANIPSMPWITSPKPQKPEVSQTGNSIEFEYIEGVRLYNIYHNGAESTLIGRHGDVTDNYLIPEDYLDENLCIKTFNNYRIESDCTMLCIDNLIDNKQGDCWDRECPTIEYRRSCGENVDLEMCNSIGCVWCPAAKIDNHSCIYDEF